MIVALSGICLYTVPELEKNFSLVRLIFLVIGGSVGIYGLILASAILVVYLVTFENYSTPLFAPFSPLITPDLKDGVWRGFIYQQTDEKAIEKKLSTENVVFYVGFDPTGNSLHVGHLLPVMAISFRPICVVFLPLLLVAIPMTVPSFCMV
jgi:hypothetical protein